MIAPALRDPNAPAGGPRTGGEAARLDAFKGVFIALIVVGHNHTAALVAGEARGALYLVHVAMFLYLPFLRERRAWNSLGWADGLVRYGWPLVVFTVLYAGLFSAFVGRAPAEALADVPYALLAMSARVFEPVTGLQILWFLPALIGLRFALKAMSALALPLPLLLLPALAAHLCVGLLPEAWLRVTPFGWPIVAYLLFPGLVAHLLHRGGFRIALRQVGPALLVAAILAYVYRVSGSAAHGSAPLFNLGKLEVPSIVEPVRLLAADAAQLLVLFGAMTLCGLAAVQRVFSGLGRASFAIYLIHQPLYVGLLALSRKLGFGADGIAAGLVLLTLTLALSLAAARLLARAPRLQGFVFPGGLPTRRVRPEQTPAFAHPHASDPPALR